MPVKAIKWLLMRHGPLVIRPSLDPAMWRWVFAMLRNCTAARYAVNKSRMVPIAEYSRDLLRELRAETGIAYDERSQGTLQLFRTQKQLDGVGQGHRGARRVRRAATRCSTATAASRAEPALGPRAGQVRRRPAPAGRRDRRLLHVHRARSRELAAARGVEFRFGDDDRAASSPTATASPASPPSAGPVAGDAYVVALGSYSPLLLKPLGIDLPVYPVKGYSITVPITDPAGAPGIDGDGRDLQGRDHPARRPHPRRRHGRARRLRPTLHAARRATLEHVVTDLFPGGGDAAGRQLLVRPAADDAGRHAGDRPGEVRATSGSTPATARSAGPWPAAPAACSPTSSPAARRRSTPARSASTATPPPPPPSTPTRRKLHA